MTEANPFETHYTEYDAWYDRNAVAYESEVLAVRELLPPPGDWVEIGVGSGRFASRLGIPVGVEPAEGVATLARARGVRVVKGAAESLPLEDASIDAVFMITSLCFVDDMPRTFAEATRVLRSGGRAIVAFLPRDSRFGALYCTCGTEDRFFRRATLYTTRQVLDAIDAAGLFVERTVQTLTGDPARANERVEPPSEGHGQGSFVVVSALKP